MNRELTIVLPAYNEEENLEQMVVSWSGQEKKLKEDYGLTLKVVVINDGSKDKTEELCERLMGGYPFLRRIDHPQNKGLGEAIKTGLFHVVKDCPNSRFACIMDCDNTQDPKYIADMLEKAGCQKRTQPVAGRSAEGNVTGADRTVNVELPADVVIASRYRKGSEVQGVSKFRLMTSEGAKYLYSAILRVKNVRDYTCGYRLYAREILEQAYARFGDKMIEESGFTCMAELLYKLYCVGARFAEVPFVLRYDFKQGQSKMKVLKTAMNSVKLALRLKRIPRQTSAA